MKIDCIVKAPHIYTMQGEGVGYVSERAIAIDRGKIIEIDEQEIIGKKYSAEQLIDLKHHAIFPGFIDGHMHTALAILRGLAQDTQNWMMFGLQPFVQHTREEDYHLGSKLGIMEAIKNGTTTIGDYGDPMEEVCGFIDRIGVRGNLTQTIREAKNKVYQRGELYEYDQERGEKSLERNIALFDRWHQKKDGRIRILFGPQGPDFVSEKLLLQVQKEAKKRGTKVHLHTQQGSRETEQMIKRYGKRTIPWLQERGYLDETLLAVHLTDATDEEAKLVANSGASMVLCPGSIGIIDGIVPPSVVFQEAGGSVALGSDQAPGNNCHNIINEMKLVTLFNKIKYEDPEAMPAWKALRMATIEGAKAIGVDDIVGSLESGKRCDLIAVDLQKSSMKPVFTHPMRNIVPNLIYSAGGDEVALSMVEGEVIYREGKFTKINEKDELKNLENQVKRIGKEAKDDFEAYSHVHRKFMEEGKL